MKWVSIKDRLPEENKEYSVKFFNQNCTDDCRGYAYYINGNWMSIIGLVCCAHKKENLKNEIISYKK